MKRYIKINEASAITFTQHSDYMKGLPFYGRGDFNFTVGRSQFTPGISIKQVPLSDLSRKGDPGHTEIDNSLSLLKNYFKPGDRIRGIAVNSLLDNEDGKQVYGRLDKLVPDYKNNTIRVYIKDPKTLESQEVYIDSIERIYEAIKIMRFSDYLKS